MVRSQRANIRQWVLSILSLSNAFIIEATLMTESICSFTNIDTLHVSKLGFPNSSQQI